MTPSLFLDFPSGPGEVDADGVVCHVHFPGSASPIQSHALSRAGLVEGFHVPEDAEAVCVTLAKRGSKGWIRHGRCRFDGSKTSDTLTLKDEQLGLGDPPYGEATLTLDDPLRNHAPTLRREWFHVPDEAQKVFSATDNEWFRTVRPSCDVVKKIHAPWWNNHPDSGVPGWCFSFPPPGDARYSESDLREMFVLANNMLRRKGHSVADVLTLDKSEVTEILALGLTLFGLSIYYENDHTARDKKTVERFSSTARLDGLGDCEDIAKESALAFSDLRSLENTEDTFLMKLRGAALDHQFCSCLGSVRRHASKSFEAHAFGMLVPNALFSDDMLTETERESKKRQTERFDTFRTYMCDGVYDCHPSKVKVPREEFTVDGQGAPWRYEYLVSAFVFGKGQVYFDGGKGSYGVNANDFFPTTSVSLKNALGTVTTLEQRREAATAVLRCNIPRTVRTFGHPNASPLQRFRDVTINTPHRASRLIETFVASTEEKTLRDLRGWAQDRSAPCLNDAAHNELLKLSEEFREHAAQIQPDGALVERRRGEYGSVYEPYPSSTDENEATVSVHTHHAHIGQGTRLFNPPTPEDYVAFVSRRVIGMLEKGVREHDASVVITKNHVYELNDTGTKDGLVSRLLFESGGKTDGVWDKATTMTKTRCCGGKDAMLTVNEDGRFVLQHDLDIFSQRDAHDRYLQFLEDKTGVRCVYEEHRAYASRCL